MKAMVGGGQERGEVTRWRNGLLEALGMEIPSLNCWREEKSLSVSWKLQLEISDGVISEKPIKHPKRKNQELSIQSLEYINAI